MVTITYYRTAKGSKRHASYSCANSRRRISSGDPIRIPADQVAKWEPCAHCTDAEVIAKTEGAPAKTPEPALCANSGVTNVRRMYSTCIDCGKGGTVNRSTGTIRAHKPA